MNEFELNLSVYFISSYFDSDDLDDDPHRKSKLINKKKLDDDLDYQPAPGSPSYKAEEKEEEEEEDDEDPLEQFMKANNNQAKKDLEVMGKKKEKKQEK